MGRGIANVYATTSTESGEQSGFSGTGHYLIILCLTVLAALLGPGSAFGAAPIPRSAIPSLDQSGLSDPCGAVTDSRGNLYVADYAANKIKVFSPTGALITEFTASANAEKPCSLAVNSAGNIYADGWGTDVVKYKPEGAGFPPTSGTTYEPDTSIGAGSGTLVPNTGEATSVAVNPANDHVFVAEGGTHVSEYTASGSVVSSTIGETVAPGHSYYGVDVYGKTENVYVTDLEKSRAYVLNPAGNSILAEIDGTTSPDGEFEFAPFLSLAFLAVDQSNGDVLVSDIHAHGVVDEFEEGGGYVTTISGTPAFTDAEPSDVAVDNGAQSPNKGDIFVTSGNGTVYAFGPLPQTGVPLVVKKEGVGTGAVTSSPDGIDCGSTCEAQFEEGAEITLTPSADPGSRFKQWSGCTSVPSDLCKVVLGAEGAEVSAIFVPAAPTIANLTTSQVTASSAKLEGVINPNGDAASYQFEYLTMAAYEANGESFSGTQTATKIPVSSASIGSGFAGVAVAQAVGGLSASTAYRFRLVASSLSGTTPSTTGAFTTQLSQAAGLPDGRAYEQASPTNKNGGSIQAFVSTTKASVNGDAVTFESAAGIPGGEGAQEFATYLASRKVNTETQEAEWTTQGILPPATAGQAATVLGWTPDFAEVFDGATKFGSGSDFLGRASAGASLETIAHSDSSTTSYSFAGTSANKDTVIFAASEPLPLPSGSPAPAAGKLNVYAWDRVASQVRLAGILPDGSAPPNGSLAGLFGNSGYTQQQPAVMSDGSVYFTAASQLYLRENPTAPETTDRDGEGNCIPTSGLACTIQISASEKNNGGGPDGTDAAGVQPAQFMVASTSTSKAFFTSSEKLTNDATTGPEPTLAAVARAKLGASGAEDVEEDFLPTRASGIANDGSHVYWADPATGSIGRATLNGDGDASEVEPEFLTIGGSPRWVALDSTYAYWTDSGKNEADGEGTIGRVKLDGSEATEPEFITGASQPQGIAVNGTNIYWANDGTRSIARATIGGGSVETSWHFLNGNEAPQGVAVDPAHVYWTTNNASSSFLASSKLDGSEEEVAFLGSSTVELRGIAVDAGHVYWVARGENKIGRANLDLTGVEPSFISGTEKSKGLTADASHLYWSANGESLPNPGKDLYRYDVEAPAGERLTDVSVDHSATDTCTGGVLCGAQVQGVIGASADGSYVYYVANGVPNGAIQNSPNANGESAEAGSCQGPVASMTGECNLYLWHEEGAAETTTFIARLDPSGSANGDVADWVQTLAGFGGLERTGQKTARVSPDGQTLLFRSQRALTGYDSGGTSELYRFSPGGTTLLCVSCSPTGVAPVGPATLGTIRPPVGGAPSPASLLSRNLAAAGKRVFFETDDKLVSADTNGDVSCAPWGSSNQKEVVRTCQDVYEWEAQGQGSCSSDAQNGGCLYLLSTGKGKEPAFFSDASESGDDVFVFTADQLVGQDKDELIDVYDVKVGGGIPAQNQPESQPCQEEACKGLPPVPPATQVPGSGSFSGPANPKPTRHHKKKHHKKKHKKKHHKHKHAAKTTGRVSR